MHRPFIRAAATVTALSVIASPAYAWDSICYRYDDPTAAVADLPTSRPSDARGCEGLDAARGRWRDPVKHIDEHRQLFDAAVAFAGLPATLLETQRLHVITDRSLRTWDVHGLTSTQSRLGPTVAPWTYSGLIVDEPPAWMPARWGFSGVTRAYALDEMAQLPDFSFGLWDWASGNETCPIKGVRDALSDPQQCHQFRTHMGATNANHFPPQSDDWFDHYHQLAITAAKRCLANRLAVFDQAFRFNIADGAFGGMAYGATFDDDNRLAGNWRACEVEALTYEAIAQHYLQDSFSAGHMWQRWGTADISELTPLVAEVMPPSGASLLSPGDPARVAAYNQLATADQQFMLAELVAVVSGTVHGSDNPFFEVGMTAHDPMCYPDADVTVWTSSSTPDGAVLAEQNVIGDLHQHDLVPMGDSPLHRDIATCAPGDADGCDLPYDPTTALAWQRHQIISCMAGSLLDVYRELGAPGRGIEPTFGRIPDSAIAFDREACRAPMVTNRAIWAGVSGDNTDLHGGQLVVTWLGPTVGTVDDIPRSLSNRLTQDYMRYYALAQLAAVRNPGGVNLAAEPPPLMGVERNGYYAAQAGPSLAYADPPPVGAVLPTPIYPVDDTREPEPSHAWYLSRTYHQARAVDRCSGAGTLTSSVSEILHRTRQEVVVDQRLHGDERAATCAACAEWVAPLVWNTANYASTTGRIEKAPLCSLTPGYPARVKTAGGGFGLAWNRAPFTVADLRTGYASTGAGWAPIAMWDSPDAYQGDAGDGSPEALAALMCCAPLDALDERGGYRLGMSVTARGRGVVGYFLRPADAAPVSVARADSTPLFAYTSTFATSLREPTDDGDRYRVAYGPGPRDVALFQSAPVDSAAVAASFFHEFTNPAHTLPDTPDHRYVLQPLTPAPAASAPGALQCRFRSNCVNGAVPRCEDNGDGSVTLTLDAQQPEIWGIEFTCE